MSNIFSPRRTELSESFMGSGNAQEDAKTGAEIKYSTWLSQMRKDGKKVEVENLDYHYRQLNDVYCRCELKVMYHLD